MSLRDLDDRVLPGAASRLRRSAETLERSRGRAEEVVRGLRPQALDARFADAAIVARLRDRPVLAGLAALALLLSGLGAAAVLRPEGDGSVVPGQVAVTDSGGRARASLLGPGVGVRTDSYERAATQGLVTAVQADPMSPRVALVSLADYRTPAEVGALLAGFEVARVFLRARAAGKAAATLPVDVKGDLLLALERAYADTARNRAAAHRSYQGYVDILTGTSKQDEAFRALYAAFAKASRIEAREYGHDCACVFGLLVTASPAQLLTLRARPGVRVVQVAGAGLTAAFVQVQPLLPEVVGIVPRPGAGAS